MPKLSKQAIVLAAVAVVITLALAIAYLVWPSFRDKVGDVRPALLPPKKALVGDDLVNFKMPAGFRAGLFAQGIGGARDIAFSPGGTLLASSPGTGRVFALPDKDNDGEADDRVIAAGNLDNPHGITFYKGKLFIAEETRLIRYKWDEKTKKASAEKKLLDLPRGGRHSTRTIAFNKQGQMFVSIGSTCDVCREEHPFIATVIVSDSEGANPRAYAKGLRNAVFIINKPDTNELWGTEMGRDFLGDNLPPDEVNIIRDGGNYGWPDCYGNKVPDRRFNSKASCGSTLAPAYNIPAHSAPLGLLFVNSRQFPDEFDGDLLVAYHGSWNRSTPTGYKVVRLEMDGDKVVKQHDFITGFISGSQAIGRPVDMDFDREGSLYLSDDKAGAIYKIVR